MRLALVAFTAAFLISFSARSTAQIPSYVRPPDNCGEIGDEVVFTPIIRKWMRGEKINDGGIYCSRSAVKATSSLNSSIIQPKLIDLDGDGKMELAVGYNCSPTGNCAMNIYRRSGRFYRTIFREIHYVQTMKKVGQRHNGFFDLYTTMHGSCCDGDFVKYRFDGRKYRPLQCGEYSYYDKEHPGETVEKVQLTVESCKNFLN